MDNIVANQKSLLNVLNHKGLQSIEWSETRGIAAYLRGNFGVVDALEPLPPLMEFIKEFGALFGPQNLVNNIQFVRTRSDSLGWRHLEFKQTYNGLNDSTVATHVPEPFDVYGGFLVAHLDSDNQLVSIQSSCWRDVFVIPQKTINRDEFGAQLVTDFLKAPGLSALLKQQPENIESLVIQGRPELIILPYQGGFRLSYLVQSIVPYPYESTVRHAQFSNAQIFIDAVSGERLQERVYASHAEFADTGNGQSQLPYGGPFRNRVLDIVRVDDSSVYRLRDTTHSRDIITYDFAGALPDYINTSSGLSNGTIAVSTDNDGDSNWNNLAVDDSIDELVASQQAETDAHYETARVYEWYSALAGAGGRAGWDDNNYAGSVPSDMPVHVLAHVNVGNAQFYINRDNSNDWVSYISFSDNTGSGGHRAWSASPFIVSHEYHHGITAHSVGSSVPGFTTGFYGWARATSEGLSDVFGGLYSGAWYAGLDISNDNTILRNLAFPRDGESSSPAGLDHFDDVLPGADRDPGPYPLGLILAHAAFLMSQGGVHQRSGRTPEFIPVHGLGNEDREGLSVATAAVIWYRMMSTQFAAVGPYEDDDVFRRVRTQCETSAIELYSEGSREHRNVVQAFYAVGLHPEGETYGADITALRWGYSWRYSMPYIGLSSPNWSSLDLFINNGGSSEWNAIANVDASDVVFENNVYCRIRNVGDQEAYNILVTFEYAKHGTAPVVWQTMRDQEGVAQQLTLGSLAAGASNFSMDQQNTPPDETRVNWHIPPLAEDEEVDHFCIRATFSASNDVHPYNNVIQSNVAYSEISAMMSRSFAFTIGNPTLIPLPVELDFETTLPPSWIANIRENLNDVILSPKEERTIHLDIDRPDGPDLEMPLDAELRGEMCGELTGDFTGTLTRTHYDSPVLTGYLSACVAGGLVNGQFKGELHKANFSICGQLTGTYQCGGKVKNVCVKINACLRPVRRVDISQRHGKEVLGGVSFQFQIPTPKSCGWPNTPTCAKYHSDLFELPNNEETHDAKCSLLPAVTKKVKVKEITYDCNGCFIGCVLVDCHRSITCYADEPSIESVLLKAFQNRWPVKVELNKDCWICEISLVL